MLHQGILDAFAKAKRHQIIDERSQAVFEDILNQCKAQKAKLEKHMQQLQGQVIQLSIMDQMLTSVLGRHVNAKIEEDAAAEREEKALNERAENARRLADNIMERRDDFTEEEKKEITRIRNNHSEEAALDFIRELIEIKETKKKKNIKHKEEEKKETEENQEVEETQPKKEAKPSQKRRRR